METLTANGLKALANDTTNITAMKALFQAIAFCESLRPIVEGKQQEIVSFYKFKVSEEVKKHTDYDEITKPNRMYLASDEDFKIYDSEMQAFYFSSDCPVKPSKAGNCPLLEAEHLVRRLKWEIADLFAPIVGLSCDQLTGNLAGWNQYWEIMLSMFAPKVKEII